MSTRVYAFGEMLWDCLPSGRHAGGAPLNVCAHLAQLGAASSLISAVGQDALGDEILQIARDKGVNTDLVGRARAGLATGTVQVTLDARSNASYEIVQPVAWDAIVVSEDAVRAVEDCEALVFGSLAVRGPENALQLERLLEITGPLKCFDVNLRPPFVDLSQVVSLAKRADVVKLNDDELGLLAGWIGSGTTTQSRPSTMPKIADACALLAGATGARRVCVTRGADGAALWADGVMHWALAPAVAVRDTIGAGDAFMAGLVLGLTRGRPNVCPDYAQTLDRSCRLGAYVASQDGATPSLPAVLVGEFAGG